MSQAEHRALIRAVLQGYGRTYAEEVRIAVEKNIPSALFQLLYTALLLSARIAAGNAVEAARALNEAGLTTPRKMAEATWQDRVDVITWHGYKRYDEKTSTMLGQAADLILEQYRGDLRNLREKATREVDKEKALLQQFKGIGPVGADIFLREIQVVWDEVYPYADSKVIDAAARLGLPADRQRLADLVAREDFARLASGLIRIDLGNAYEQVKAAARG